MKKIIHIHKEQRTTLNKDLPYFFFSKRQYVRPCNFFFFLKLGFTPCKAEQPLRGMELQEKKHKKDYRIQKICLERT